LLFLFWSGLLLATTIASAAAKIPGKPLVSIEPTADWDAMIILLRYEMI
jgi:hypothetical protein